jgi:hypothetical protein
MAQQRFDSDLAHDMSTETFAPMSDSGNRPPKTLRWTDEDETPKGMKSWMWRVVE